MLGYKDAPQSIQTDELNQSITAQWRPLLRTEEMYLNLNF